jgi:uncharacterized repeat protein (TIGR02543 family)
MYYSSVFLNKNQKPNKTMKKKNFQAMGTTWRRARLSLLGAMALTALTANVTQAQPAFDVGKTIYWLDFSTVPGAVWGTAQANVGAPYGTAQPNNNGVVNYRYNMTGGVYYGSVAIARLLSHGGQSAGTTSDFDPARSKGAVMFQIKLDNSAVYGSKDTAPYVEIPVVKNPKEVWVYGQTEGGKALKIAVELLDATVPVQPSGAGVSVSGDVILETSGDIEMLATGSGTRYGRVNYSVTGSLDSARVRVRMYGDYNANARLFDIYVLGENAVEPTSVALSTDTVMGAGGVYTINAQVSAGSTVAGYYPFADKTIVWSLVAGDDAKADINGTGLTASLVAKVTGVVGVIATTSNGLADTLTIPIEAVPAATSVKIVAAEPVLPPGSSTLLTATVLPATADQAITWSLLGATDATLTPDPNDNHKATFSAGTAEEIKKVAVQVVATPTVTDTISLDVSDVKVASLTITGPLSIYGVGSTATLSVSVLPSNARIQTVAWASDNAAVATIDAATGVVTSVAVGSTSITASATDGSSVTASATLSVSTTFVDSMNAPNATSKSTLATSNSAFSFGIMPRDETIENPTDSLLRYVGSAMTGGRRAQYTMASPVPFTKKAVVEFDWTAGTYTAPDANEGQLTIRGGHTTATDHNNMANNDYDIFTLAVRGKDRSSNVGIYAGVGPINAPITSSIVDFGNRLMLSGASAIPEPYLVTFSDAPLLGTWYHVRLDINSDAPEKNVALTLTCLDTAAGGAPKYAEQKVRIPAPAGWKPQAVDNLFINCIRTGNFTWSGYLDNFSVRIADNEVIPATGISVAAEYEQTGVGGANLLTATIEPFDATDLTTKWEVVSGSATITQDTATSRKATLVGTAEGDITVKATNSAGGSSTINLKVGEILLTKITISGDTVVSQGRKLTLSAATEPGNAGNATINWSSSNEAIATVDAAGVVTGTLLDPAVKSDQEVTITATAADGSLVTGTYKVYVKYTPITRIDIYGRERIFYTDAPTSVAAFTVAPTFLPTDARTGASKIDYTWGTTGDANVLSIADGTVTLTGGYGKAAVTATSNDGSNKVGYYYVEVKHAAENTYDVFSNYETEGAEPTRVGAVNSGVTNGANPNNAFQDYHGTRASYSYSNNASGGRDFLTHLKNAAVGDRINFRFDWFLGTNTDGVLSIRPDSIGDDNQYGRPLLGSGNNDATPAVDVFVAKKNILALHWDTRVGVDSFFYFTDDYSNPASNEVGAAGWPTGTYLNLAANMGGWYTIDLSVDYLLGRITTFTMTETDNPANTVTVRDIPLNADLLADVNKTRTIKAIFVASIRPGASGNNATYSVIDNLGYKAVTPVKYTLTLDPDGGTFGDGATAAKEYQAVVGESIDAYISDVSRDNYTFLGWFNGDAKYEAGQTFTANVTLTARWQVVTYTVTFAGEGITIAPQTLEYGIKVVQPAAPTRECYIFEAWYNGANRWNFATGIVTEDITLTAQWTADPECEVPSETAVSANALPGVSLYPNPVSDVLSVSGLEGNETLTVVDLSGRVLLTQKASEGTTRLSVATLPQGTYLVKVARGSAVKAVKITVSK